MDNVIDLASYREKKEVPLPIPDNDIFPETYFYVSDETGDWVADINGIPTYSASTFEEVAVMAGWDASSFLDDDEFDYDVM